MFTENRWRKPFIIALSVSVLLLLLLAGTHYAFAFRGTAPSLQVSAPDSPTGWGDDGTLEFGVEWINDFPGTVNDRSHWDESCIGLRNHLLANDWISRYYWTDWNVWETDYKKASAGGIENTMVDNVDIAMICTHGAGTYDSYWDKNLSSVFFGSTHDDQHLSPGEAYHAYGDKDLEWLAFDSCSVLSDGGPSPYLNRGYWSTTMNGLHQLLGFKNTMYVSAPGDGGYWGYFMNGWKLLWWWILPPSSVMQSWFTAVDYNQPTVTCARVLAEESNNFNDYLWGKGYVSPDYAPDGDYWYWDHCSAGLKSAEKVYDQPEILAVPRIKVADRVVDENYVQNRIAGAFDMSGLIVPGNLFYFMLDTTGGITRTLQVDRVSGSFLYRNLSELWVPPASVPDLPDEYEAWSYLDNWFKVSGEGLPGAWYRNDFFYDIEQMVEVGMALDENGVLSEQEMASIPTDGMMTYQRTVSSPVLTANGSQELALPVFGPGGRMKVYLGEGNKILGMIGGSRDLEDTGLMVETLAAADAWEKYLANPSLAIPEVPVLGDTIIYTSAILGYYEQPYINHQSELIPVWNFKANFYAKGALVEDNVDVYVPAAYDYMPPEVTIISPADGDTFSAGELVNFEGTINGGIEPYIIEWTSSSDGILGNEKSIVHDIGSSVRGGAVSQVTVSFQVTDGNGLIATDTITLNINPIFWIPLVNK